MVHGRSPLVRFPSAPGLGPRPGPGHPVSWSRASPGRHVSPSTARPRRRGPHHSPGRAGGRYRPPRRPPRRPWPWCGHELPIERLVGVRARRSPGVRSLGRAPAEVPLPKIGERVRHRGGAHDHQVAAWRPGSNVTSSAPLALAGDRQTTTLPFRNPPREPRGVRAGRAPALLPPSAPRLPPRARRVRRAGELPVLPRSSGAAKNPGACKILGAAKLPGAFAQEPSWLPNWPGVPRSSVLAKILIPPSSSSRGRCRCDHLPAPPRIHGGSAPTPPPIQPPCSSPDPVE